MIINTIDILAIGIIVRGIITGRSTLFISELVKILGVVLAICISIHYYDRLGRFLSEYMFVPESIADFLAYSGISFVIIFLFFLIKDGWSLIIHIQESPKFNYWGGLAVSMMKSYLLCGVMLIAFLLVSTPFFKSSAEKSLSLRLFRKLPAAIYKVFYGGIVVKLLPKEPSNADFINLMKSYNQGQV